MDERAVRRETPAEAERAIEQETPEHRERAGPAETPVTAERTVNKEASMIRKFSLESILELYDNAPVTMNKVAKSAPALSKKMKSRQTARAGK